MNPLERELRSTSPRNTLGAFRVWCGIAFGSILLYLLSVGPAVRLSEEGWLSKTAVNKVYRPLAAIGGTPLGRLLNTYVRFWLPPPQQVDAPSQR